MRYTVKSFSIAAAMIAASSISAMAWDIPSVMNTQLSPELVTQDTNFWSETVHEDLNITGVAMGNDFKLDVIGNTIVGNDQKFGADVISTVTVDVHEVMGDTKISNVAIGSNANIKADDVDCNQGGGCLTYGLKLDNSQTFITPPPPPPACQRGDGHTRPEECPVQVWDPAAITNIAIDTTHGDFALTNLASNNQLNVQAPGAMLYVNSYQESGAITTSTANVAIQEAMQSVNITSIAVGNSVNISNAFPDAE